MTDLRSMINSEVMSFQCLIFSLLEKSDEYSEPSQTTKMELFAKIFNGLDTPMKVTITFMQLILSASTPQNAQTHSNNSSANWRRIV